MKRVTWAHALLKRALDSPWPPCFMDRHGIPMVWTAGCTAVWMLLAHVLPISHDAALVSLFLVNIVWTAVVQVPFWMRIYFSASSTPRDLLIDVFDLLDLYCASMALNHGHAAGHVHYVTGLLFIQLGLRPTAIRPLPLASATALADAEFTRLQQEADLRVLPVATSRRPVKKNLP